MNGGVEVTILISKCLSTLMGNVNNPVFIIQPEASHLLKGQSRAQELSKPIYKNLKCGHLVLVKETYSKSVVQVYLLTHVCDMFLIWP